MKRLAIIALALGIFATHPAYADDDKDKGTKVTVDLKDLGSDTRNAILDSIQAKAQEKVKQEIVTPTPDKVEKWAKIGKGVGDAIAAAAHSLNVGVNEFIKTPAGQLTVWAIFLYLFGNTLWSIGAGLVIWIVIGGLIYGSFRKFHMPYKLKQKDGTVTLANYAWKEEGAQVFSAIVHVVAFVLLSIVCMIEIL